MPQQLGDLQRLDYTLHAAAQSAVFLLRLLKNMRLQAKPIVPLPLLGTSPSAPFTLLARGTPVDPAAAAREFAAGPFSLPAGLSIMGLPHQYSSALAREYDSLALTAAGLRHIGDMPYPNLLVNAAAVEGLLRPLPCLCPPGTQVAAHLAQLVLEQRVRREAELGVLGEVD